MQPVQKKQENLIMAEEKVTGSVTFKDYRNYFKYSLGLFGMFLWFLVCSAASVAMLAISLFLAYWASQPYEEQQKDFYPKFFGILIVINYLVSVLRENTIFNLVIRATTNAHKAMAERIVRAKVVFFDSTPIGRILTRFSKDMAVLDYIVPAGMCLLSYGLFRTISVTIALCIVNYWLLIPLFFVLIYFIYIVKRAAQAMIEAQRLDSIVRGPIHSLFAMVVNGLISIRAYD